MLAALSPHNGPDPLMDPETGRRFDEGFDWPPLSRRAALRALRAMSQDPDRTDMVAEFLAATSGDSMKRLLVKVLSDPQGRRILTERRNLLPLLEDRGRLAALPRGTLGREYHEWASQRGFTASGLAAQIKRVDRDLQSEAHVLAARITDMHDLWHVCNGWGSDMLGEMHLLGYSYAQLSNPGWLWLGALFNLTLITAGRYDGVGYFLRGYWLGKRARLLTAADWERLLALPLDEVRRELRIPPPRPYEALEHDEWRRLQKRSAVHRLMVRARRRKGRAA